MSNKKSVTIGICAYSSQALIEKLLSSLVGQNKGSFILKEIIVHCDISGDQTPKITKEWAKRNHQQRLIKILTPKKRLGFAGSFNQIIKNSKSDIVIVLNDDIQIKDKNFIRKISNSFGNSKLDGLACVNLKQLAPRTFIEKAVVVSIKAFEEARESKKAGNNLFSCDGKVLILSKRFINNLTLPKDLSKVGNLDAYLYFACLKQNLEYKFLKNICVFHHSPANFNDYLAWTSRNNSNYPLLKKTFGKIVDLEYQLPTRTLWQKKLGQFIKNPLHCLFIYSTSFYVKFLAVKQANNFNPKWDTILTTKVIN